MSPKDRIVYSTEHGRMCPDCGEPAHSGSCSRERAAPSVDGPVRVRRERAGRKGKEVTVIRDVPLAGDDLSALASELKKSCGSGGTIKDGAIEIQGDHVEPVIEVLRGRGWSVKRTGG